MTVNFNDLENEIVAIFRKHGYQTTFNHPSKEQFRQDVGFLIEVSTNTTGTTLQYNGAIIFVSDVQVKQPAAINSFRLFTPPFVSPECITTPAGFKRFHAFDFVLQFDLPKKPIIKEFLEE
jgi:hypothetical protein